MKQKKPKSLNQEIPVKGTKAEETLNMMTINQNLVQKVTHIDPRLQVLNFTKTPKRT